jgi:hypothetical protein
MTAYDLAQRASQGMTRDANQQLERELREFEAAVKRAPIERHALEQATLRESNTGLLNGLTDAQRTQAQPLLETCVRELARVQDAELGVARAASNALRASGSSTAQRLEILHNAQAAIGDLHLAGHQDIERQQAAIASAVRHGDGDTLRAIAVEQKNAADRIERAHQDALAATAAATQGPDSVSELGRYHQKADQAPIATLTLPASATVMTSSTTHVSNDILRKNAMSHIRAADMLASGVESAYRHHVELRTDQPVAAFVSEVFAGAHLPATSEVGALRHAIDGAHAAYKRGDLQTAEQASIAAEAEVRRLAKSLDVYREDAVTGSGRAITSLKATRDVAFATNQMLAAAATGGAAAPLMIATLGPTIGTTLAQAREVDIGLHDRVDWTGIGLDAAVGMVMSRFGGDLSQRIFGTLGQGATAATADQLRRVVGDVMIKQMLGTVRTAIVETYHQLAKQGDFNYERLIDVTVKRLMDPQSIFRDALLTEVKLLHPGR